MDNSQTQLTWRNLLNTKEQSTRSVTVTITFDQDVTVEDTQQFIFNALSNHAQICYLGTDHESRNAKPTVIQVT